MGSIDTVRDLIIALLNYNLDAKVFVGNCIYNKVYLTYGSSDGCTPKTCDTVGIQTWDDDQPEES